MACKTQELELLEIKVDGAALPWDGNAFVVTADQDLLVFGELMSQPVSQSIDGRSCQSTH